MASLLSCRPCAHYSKRRESASSGSLPNMRICANRPHKRRRSSLTASSNGSQHKTTPLWRLEVHCRPFRTELILHRIEVHCRPFRTELILCLRLHPQMKEGGAPGAGCGNKKRSPQQCQIGTDTRNSTGPGPGQGIHKIDNGRRDRGPWCHSEREGGICGPPPRAPGASGRAQTIIE